MLEPFKYCDECTTKILRESKLRLRCSFCDFSCELGMDMMSHKCKRPQLKTLKAFQQCDGCEQEGYSDKGHCCTKSDLRKEAMRWYEDFTTLHYSMQEAHKFCEKPGDGPIIAKWIKHFFNLSDEARNEVVQKI
ncbi:MAG: hypothetical protein Q8O88_01030 [bacterium]|nr:hypothetical protein [bacterium]